MAVPKSVIFTRSSLVSMMFAGLDIAMHDVVVVRELQRGAKPAP